METSISYIGRVTEPAISHPPQAGDDPELFHLREHPLPKRSAHISTYDMPQAAPKLAAAPSTPPASNSKAPLVVPYLQQSLKLDAAREQRRIDPIADGDPEHEEIVNSTRRKLEMTASAMPCKVTTPAGPNGSSWERAGASDWSKMETKRLRSSCSK